MDLKNEAGLGGTNDDAENLTGETLLACSTVRLFGRPFEGLVLHPAKLGRQIATERKPGLARIYGFSWQGNYFKLSAPAVYLVYGPGKVVEPGTDRAEIGATGVEFKDEFFSVGVLMWAAYDVDFAVRIDITAGWLSEILIAPEASDASNMTGVGDGSDRRGSITGRRGDDRAGGHGGASGDGGAAAEHLAVGQRLRHALLLRAASRQRRLDRRAQAVRLERLAQQGPANLAQCRDRREIPAAGQHDREVGSPTLHLMRQIDPVGTASQQDVGKDQIDPPAVAECAKRRIGAGNPRSGVVKLRQEVEHQRRHLVIVLHDQDMQPSAGAGRLRVVRGRRGDGVRGPGIGCLRAARQQQGDGAALAPFALDPRRSSRLHREAMHLRQAEAGALARFLRGEKRLERPRRAARRIPVPQSATEMAT